MSDHTLTDPRFAAGHALDPMGRFSGQASISIAAGIAALALGGPVIGVFGAALGAAAASSYVHLASRRRPQPVPASNHRA